jgi:hypothetical protein
MRPAQGVLNMQVSSKLMTSIITSIITSISPFRALIAVTGAAFP